MLNLCPRFKIKTVNVTTLTVLFGFSIAGFCQESRTDPEESESIKEEKTLDSVAEKKLSDIRHQLIEAAQQAASRVRSTSWLDSQGVLHETTRIDSDVLVRGMQVKSYIKSDATAVRSTKMPCKKNRQDYKRVGAVEMAIYPNDGRYGSYFLADVAFNMSRGLFKHTHLKKNWLLTSVKKYRTNYDRAIEASPHAKATYSFNISVNAPYGGKLKRRNMESILRFVDNNYSPKLQKRSRRPIELSLSVTENNTGKMIWNKTTTLMYPAIYASISSQELPAEFTAVLNETIKTWGKEIDRQLSCQPFFFDVLYQTPDTFTINAGTRVGIQAGDHLIMANREKVPFRVLEEGALEQTVLVMVESVTKDRAQLKKIAGPNPKFISNIAAMPL